MEQMQKNEENKNAPVAESPKEDAYDFSKEFSKEGRHKLAAEISQMRKHYMKELPAENALRAEKRSELTQKKRRI